MEKYRKRFKRGKAYTIRNGDLKVKITYCGRFQGPKRTSSGYPNEEFVVFRLEPKRFPRLKK